METTSTPDRVGPLLRAAILSASSIVVGFTVADVDQACGAVAVGAAGAGFVTGMFAGPPAHAAKVCWFSASAYFVGLFLRAARDDNLNLLPFALVFMGMFAAIHRVSAWLAPRLQRGSPAT